MNLNGFLWVLASAGLTVLANLLLRGGVLRGGGFGFTQQQLLRVAFQPLFLAGVVFYGLAALVWFRVISQQPLTTAYPLLVSMTFVFVTIGAAHFFGERVSVAKVSGMLIILLGVLVVARS